MVKRMIFISTDVRWAEDNERHIRIHLAKVAGLHLINNDRNKWKVFLKYESPKLDFTCRYYVKFSHVYYECGGKAIDQEITSTVVIPRDQLVAAYMSSANSIPSPADLKQLYTDVEAAIVAREKVRRTTLEKHAVAPPVKVALVDRVESDDRAAELLDRFTPGGV